MAQSCRGIVIRDQQEHFLKYQLRLFIYRLVKEGIMFGIDWDLDGDVDIVDDLITLELLSEDDEGDE